jgi:periplasmic copper chaperone A
MRFPVFALATCLVPSVAFAHASLETKEAKAGSLYKAVIHIPHGCEGKPTDKVVITTPEGFISAKPMPKPGWTLDIKKGSYNKAYENHGKAVTEGALEVTWSGGSLPDDQFDAFMIMGKLAGFTEGQNAVFKTVQYCGTDSIAWADIPTEGQDSHSLAFPAPQLVITTADTKVTGHHQHGAQPMAHAGTTVTLGDLTLEQFFTRATPAGAKAAGGFLTITNNGKTDDRLVSVSSLMATRTEIHEMAVKDTIMTMRPKEDGILLPAGQTVSLKPGGLHIMFMQIKEPFKKDMIIPVTLTFEKAGSIDIEMPVILMGSKAPAHH